MLHYSNKIRPPFLEAPSKISSSKENVNLSGGAYQKLVLARPAFNQIPRADAMNASEGLLTPKTSRSTHNAPSTLNSSFSKLNNIAPDRQKVKKQLSFASNKISNKYEKTLGKYESDIKQKELSFKINNDRSHQILKNVMFKDTNKTIQQRSKLRQTVDHSTQLAYTSHFPPKPIKTQIQFQNGFQSKPIRKKVQSEYIPCFKLKAQIKQSFPPRIHNRNKTELQGDTEDIKDINIVFKQPLSLHATPRQSMEKLTKSVKISNMNQTDPNGSYFHKNSTSKIHYPPSNFRIKASKGFKLQDFELGACKGEGRFGKVFPVRHKLTGFLMGLKQIKKQAVRLMLDQFVQELKISLYLNHSNVVKMYGFFHDQQNFYILMEYMEEGSLYKIIKTHTKLQEEEVVAKLVEICQGLNYLHSLDILHRDIKPQNIVLSNGVSKICDFGWAIYSKERRTTYCGTLDYVCPQILQGQSYDSFVDIWAIGVLAFQMLAGKAPFYHISRQQTMKSIMKCQFAFPEDLSPAAKSFIRKSLQKNVEKRLTIQQLLKDKFLSQNNEEK